jgi:hypothetical protein
MILAIAVLLLHLSPATDTRIATDIAATTATAASPAVAPSTATSAHGSSSPRASSTASTITLADSISNSQSFQTLRLPEPTPVKPVRIIAVETAPARRSWLILSFAQHGAATFDAYTTRQAVSAGAREDDPLMRPFANSPAIYAVSQIGPALLDYAARRMQRSQHAFVRRSWWLPQSVSTSLYIFCGTHNLHIAPNP